MENKLNRIKDYLKEISALWKTNAATEHSYRAALQSLLADLIPNVTVVNEPAHIACGVSLIMLDGDFLNYDFALHKESKYSNYTEYNHGPYGEGSVRHRKMYTYPNPLNSRIKEFFLRHIVIAKKTDFESGDSR